MNNLEARAAFVRILMQRVLADRHPSPTYLSMIEQALPPQWIPDYVEILLKKVADDERPSLSMLQRIGRLIDQTR